MIKLCPENTLQNNQAKVRNGTKMKTNLKWILMVLVLSLTTAHATYLKTSEAQLTKVVESYSKMIKAYKEQLKSEVVKKGSQKFKLKFLTINLGLLYLKEVTMFGQVVKHVKVPRYVERSEHFHTVLGDFLKKEKIDVVFVQELWNKTTPDLSVLNGDIATLRQWCDENNYVSISAELERLASAGNNTKVNPTWAYSQVNTGLDILVRLGDRTKEQVLADFGFDIYTYSEDGLWQSKGDYVRATMESGTVAGVANPFPEVKTNGYIRGGLWGKISLGDEDNLLVINTHLTPLISNYSTRDTQISRSYPVVYGKEKDETAITREAKRASFIVFGGDFNFSPLYEDVDHHLDISYATTWDKNPMSYLKFQDTNKLYDSFIIANGKDNRGFTWSTANELTSGKEAPTAADKNEEPDQRLDLIWVKSGKEKGFEVNNSRVVFNKETSHGWYLSDHYGVQSNFTFYSK